MNRGLLLRAAAERFAKAEIIRVAKAQEVQSVRFDKKKFTAKQARTWLKDHDFKAGKLDETSNQLRFRQFAPGRCTGEFKVLSRNFPAGITAVSCNVPSKKRDEFLAKLAEPCCDPCARGECCEVADAEEVGEGAWEHGMVFHTKAGHKDDGEEEKGGKKKKKPFSGAAKPFGSKKRFTARFGR